MTGRRGARVIGVLLAAAVLCGCAITQVGQEGRVTVILDARKIIATTCGRMTGAGVVGCSQAQDGHYLILCPLDDPHVTTAQCLAHEVRHIVEPAWRHE